MSKKLKMIETPDETVTVRKIYDVEKLYMKEQSPVEPMIEVENSYLLVETNPKIYRENTILTWNSFKSIKSNRLNIDVNVNKKSFKGIAKYGSYLSLGFKAAKHHLDELVKSNELLKTAKIKILGVNGKLFESMYPVDDIIDYKFEKDMLHVSSDNIKQKFNLPSSYFRIFRYGLYTKTKKINLSKKTTEEKVKLIIKLYELFLSDIRIPGILFKIDDSFYVNLFNPFYLFSLIEDLNSIAKIITEVLIFEYDDDIVETIEKIENWAIKNNQTYYNELIQIAKVGIANSAAVYKSIRKRFSPIDLITKKEISLNVESKIIELPNPFSFNLISDAIVKIKQNFSDVNIKFVVPAHVVIINNLFYPYYGLSIVKFNFESPTGMHLNPILYHVNINLNGGNVCFGSESKTIENIKIQSISNSHSSYLPIIDLYSFRVHVFKRALIDKISSLTLEKTSKEVK